MLRAWGFQGLWFSVCVKYIFICACVYVHINIISQANSYQCCDMKRRWLWWHFHALRPERHPRLLLRLLCLCLGPWFQLLRCACATLQVSRSSRSVLSRSSHTFSTEVLAVVPTFTTWLGRNRVKLSIGFLNACEKSRKVRITLFRSLSPNLTSHSDDLLDCRTRLAVLDRFPSLKSEEWVPQIPWSQSRQRPLWPDAFLKAKPLEALETHEKPVSKDVSKPCNMIQQVTRLQGLQGGSTLSATRVYLALFHSLFRIYLAQYIVDCIWLNTASLGTTQCCNIGDEDDFVSAVWRGPENTRDIQQDRTWIWYIFWLLDC